MIGNEKWPLKGAISWDCFGSIVHWKTIGILEATKICQPFGCHSMYWCIKYYKFLPSPSKHHSKEDRKNVTTGAWEVET